jgi:formylglycine-generating enzyme required for sulfatase activity
VAFEFVHIPAGRFQMGSNSGESDERPPHEVAIEHDFLLLATEVTVRQFEAFVEKTGYKTDAERHNWAWLCPAADLAGPDRGLNWRTPGFGQSPDDPAVVLSWNDATAFCRWLSAETGRTIQLATEAQWEYAARAGGDKGNVADLDIAAWYEGNAGGATHPVGQRRPDAWGLYDMRGNAWEWCRDVWHPSYEGAPADGTARTSDPGIPQIARRHVLRGGCWASPVPQLRPTYRYRGTKNFRNCGTGFRVVVDEHDVGDDLVADAPASQRTDGTSSYRARPAATAGRTARLTVVGAEFELVRIRGGKFVMGSDVHGEEEPMHEVTIGYDFEIGRTEVTRAQFAAFVEATGYITEAEKEGWGWTRSGWRDWHPEVEINWRNPGFAQTDDHPATCVSWYDAMAFCRWLSAETGQTIRLPSGAEWEYACRAGTTGHFAGDIDVMGWHRYNSGQRTHSVAQKGPNAWGLYDMHGNVWEWCQDMWHYGYEGAPADGSPWVTADIFIPLMRGGSFTNPQWWLRSANHMRNDPGCRHSYNQGLRIVRDLRPSRDEKKGLARQQPASAVAQLGSTAEVQLVPVEIELPQPQFEGTPKNMRASRIKPVQTEPGPPFLAPVGTTNVALGKPVSSSDAEPVIGELAMITDGDKEAAHGSFVELGPLLQHVTIDLEAEHEIYGVRLWHYHLEARVYFDVIVQVSNDPNFGAGVTTIFNNDMDNSAGLGAGRDMHYVDTYFGELFDAKGVRGRYVRLYSRGSSADDLNHYIEVEVYARPAPELVPLDIQLPEPTVVGRPTVCFNPPTLEKPRAGPRPPFLAPVGTTNVALGKPVTSSAPEPISGQLQMIADGDKSGAVGHNVELPPSLQHVTIDLGRPHDISAVLVWHHHNWPRVYFDVIVQVCNDPDFVDGVETIFNNNHDDSAKLGKGTQLNYVESYEGKLIDAKGVGGRYVRLYSNGNTSNDLNHYIEVEVYGRPVQ